MVAAPTSSSVNVPQAGDFFGHMKHIGGFVGPAAMWRRRQVGRVGLDQHAIERDKLRDFLEGLGVLEGDDAGKGDVKTQVECRPCRIQVFGEAVEDAADLPALLLAQQPQGVG